MATQVSILIFFILSLLLSSLQLQPIHATLPHKPRARNSTTTSASPWLDSARRRRRPREHGCWFQPWICKDQLPPFSRRLCCKNRCVDVGSEVDNCGLCGIRCPFSWQCCNGFCVDTMINPFHCGSCANRCPFGSLCLYGLCGYTEPLPPFPFPLPPKHPKKKMPARNPPPLVVVFPPEPPMGRRSD